MNLGGGEFSNNGKIIFLDDDIYNFKDCYVWSKIYKKSTIIKNKIKFPEDKLLEDVYFILLLLPYLDKIVYLEKYVGYLRHYQDYSLAKTINYDKAKEIINILYEIHDFYKNNKINVDFSWFSSNFISFCLWGIYQSNILYNKKEINDLLKYIYNFETETNFNNSYLNIIYRIPNQLIIKKHFKSAIIYLKIIKSFYSKKSFKKIYRKFLINK